MAHLHNNDNANKNAGPQRRSATNGVRREEVDDDERRNVFLPSMDWAPRFVLNIAIFLFLFILTWQTIFIFMTTNHLGTIALATRRMSKSLSNSAATLNLMEENCWDGVVATGNDSVAEL